MKTTETFTAFWIGKCPTKGCHNALHLDIPMVRERWTETHHDHAHGHSWEVNRKREFPAPPYGSHFHPFHLGLACTKHRRDILWKAVNGRLVEEHKCDSRCNNATGPNCDCSCGGANHGRAYSVTLSFA